MNWARDSSVEIVSIQRPADLVEEHCRILGIQYNGSGMLEWLLMEYKIIFPIVYTDDLHMAPLPPSRGCYHFSNGDIDKSI